MSQNNEKSNIISTSLNQVISQKYLSYALSTITSRSLPDVRDGLKPVHRRILYAMYESGNTPNKGFKKSASAVGFVMMKYHPHGDQAIYDSLVRMSQAFITRYPLIIGQGNFGSIDGDNAAAMRYTEAKLSNFAMEMLNGIDEDSIDFIPSYNNESQEPTVLPCRYPNLLINGSSGIAVGMATNIPPHNLSEVCKATIELINNEEISIAQLMQYIQGPDFPTGGIVIEAKESLLRAYECGRGSIKIRAKIHKEELSNGQYHIVVSEIPYMVQKTRLIEKIAELWNNKKLPLISDIKDESTTDVRIVIIPKSRNVDMNILMESLYRATDLESNFNLNLNVLKKGKIPQVMNLKQVLQEFINHRIEVLIKSSNFKLNKILERLEILQGFLVAFLNIDQIIKIIRYHDSPKDELSRVFNLSKIQVEAILNMRLRTLRKLEEIQIAQEIKSLEKQQKELEKILNSPKQQRQTLIEDLQELQQKYSDDKRKTSFAQITKISNEELIHANIEKESVTVICSQKGWIKTIRGHNVQPNDLKFKEGDNSNFIFKSETTDKILILSSTGKIYTLRVDELPGGRGHGSPINLIINMGNDECIADIFVYNAKINNDTKAIIVANDGRGFIIKLHNTLAQTKNGKQILNVKGNVLAYKMHIIDDQHDMVAIIGINRKLLIFPLVEIPEMPRGRGVILQKYIQGKLSDLKTFIDTDGLSWQLGERIRNEKNLLLWTGKRGQRGKLPPNGFPKSNCFQG